MHAQITVKEFLAVRQHVANLLKQDSQTQAPTRIRQAENLMAAGVIDVQSVIEQLNPVEVYDEVEVGQEP